MEKLFSTLGSFLSELRRRRVVHVLIVYAVVAGGVIEVSDIVLPALQLPPWTVRLVVVLALAGLPVALVLGWAFDVTPEGIRRTRDLPADAEKSGHPDVQSPRFRLAMTLSVVLVMAAATWVAWSAWLSPAAAGDAEAAAAGDGPEELSRTRVAVLPFDDYSEGGQLTFLAEGLTEDLIHELTQVGALEVVSRYGVQPYDDVNVAFDSVARALDAGSIVEGSVSRDEDSVRVTVQLIDGRTASHIASTRLQEPARGDLSRSALSLRDRLVEASARLLRRELGEEIRLEEIRAGTDDPVAWAAFHRASRLEGDARELATAGDTGAARRLYLQADSLLRTAEAEDPDWPAPTVQRGWVAWGGARLAGSARTDLDPGWLRRGIRHANRALREDPGHAGALELRGVLRYQLSYVVPGAEGTELLEAAEADLREAVTTGPDRARAWIMLADLLRSRGRLREALVAARRSREADPYLGNDRRFFWLAAQMALDLQDFDEARRLLDRGARWYPGEPALANLHLLLLASTATSSVQVDSAWAVEEQLRSVIGSTGKLLVGAVLARLGMGDSARAVVRRATEGGTRSPYDHYYGAYARLQLGDTAAALNLLERHLEALPQQKAYIATEFWWDPLHGDPRFEALVSENSPPGARAR